MSRVEQNRTVLLQKRDPLDLQTDCRKMRLGSQAPFMIGEMAVFMTH